LDRRLTTADVMRIYDIKRPKTARDLMAKVGAFPVADKLVVRASDLLAWEERQIAARTAVLSARPSPGPSAPRRGRTGPEKPPAGPPPRLDPDWHRRPLESSSDTR
jgi:hypothetical protein